MSYDDIVRILKNSETVGSFILGAVISGLSVFKIVKSFFEKESTKIAKDNAEAKKCIAEKDAIIESLRAKLKVLRCAACGEAVTFVAVDQNGNGLRPHSTYFFRCTNRNCDTPLIMSGDEYTQLTKTINSK